MSSDNLVHTEFRYQLVFLQERQLLHVLHSYGYIMHVHMK